MGRTLIKNGTVVTATDQYKGDVLVEDEKITVIGSSLDMHADKVIDASGKYVLPGGIDDSDDVLLDQWVDVDLLYRALDLVDLYGVGDLV